MSEETTADLYIKNCHYVDEYQKETGEKATYRRDSSDYHTLKYIVWFHNKLSEARGQLEAMREFVDKMIRGGETVEALSKGSDFYEAKGALLAFKRVKELLHKEGK